MKEINYRTLVPVVDRYGKLIEWRTIYQPPFPFIFPDQAEPERLVKEGRIGYVLHGVVVIDYRRYAEQPKDDRFLRPTQNELIAGVEYNGDKFYPYYWGSGVKRGVILGFKSDFLKLEKLEQSVYGARYLLASSGGYHGATVASVNYGDLKIGILPEGGFVDGAGWVADGFGFVSAKAAACMNTIKPIELGKSKPSAQLAQWISTENGAWDEIQQLIGDQFQRMASPDEDGRWTADRFMAQTGMLTDERAELIEINPDMAKHPFIVDLPASTFAEAWARLATSIPFDAKTKVAIPIPGDRLVMNGATGKYGWVRYPLDGPTIQAGEIERRPEYEEYLNRELVQYTLAGVSEMGHVFAKGIMSVVPDLGEFDAIICSEDIKIADVGIKKAREYDHFTVSKGGLFYMSRYAKGSAVGLDPEHFKIHQGGDFDGDMVSVFNLDGLPYIYDQIKAMDIGFETVKVKKTYTKFKSGEMAKRAELIHSNMVNLVGIASNLMSADLSIGDLDLVATKLGYHSKEKLLYNHNRAIKEGTDGFKSFLDLETTVKNMMADQSQFVFSFGALPPFQAWVKGGWAFVHDVPRVGFDESWDDEHKKYCLPSVFQGTVAKIARLTLPAIRQAYRNIVCINMLSYYRDMVLRPSREYREHAKALQNLFNVTIKRPSSALDDEDGTGWQQLKSECQQYASEYIEQHGLNRGMLARALWHYAHDRKTGRAASVFFMFPDECRDILKAGVVGQDETVIMVSGLGYQLDNPPHTAEWNVTVTTAPVTEKGRLVIRSVLCGNVHGQKPARKPYPHNMLAVVTKESTQPEPGRYTARFEQFSPKAWRVRLSPR